MCVGGREVERDPEPIESLTFECSMLQCVALCFSVFRGVGVLLCVAPSY